MNNTAREQETELAASDNPVLGTIARAELHQAIVIAHTFPRSLKQFQNECMDMATLNEQVAAECIYAIPRDGKTIEGPSARLAEIVASAWGNCRAGARVVDEGPEFITAQGIFHDLERNVSITYEVRRRITDKRGKRFSADMIAVTGNAACSIALRNAVFKGVPKAFWSNIYDAARLAAIGDVKTIANKRADALAYLQKMGVTPGQVLRVLNVVGVEDIGTDQLVTLRGLMTAIRDGEASVDSVFADPKGSPGLGKVEIEKPSGYDAWLDGLRPVADEGADVLAAVFEKAPPNMRQYLTGPDHMVWAALKAKATRVAA